MSKLFSIFYRILGEGGIYCSIDEVFEGLDGFVPLDVDVTSVLLFQRKVERLP